MESNGVQQWMSAQRAGGRSFTSERRMTLRGHRARCGDSHGHSGQRRLSLWRVSGRHEADRAGGPGEQCEHRSTRPVGVRKNTTSTVFPWGCQGSGESQLSSLISTVEGRKDRRAISPGSPATEEAWREGGKVRWRRKEVVFVGPLRHLRGDRREQRKESESHVYGTWGRAERPRLRRAF